MTVEAVFGFTVLRPQLLPRRQPARDRPWIRLRAHPRRDCLFSYLHTPRAFTSTPCGTTSCAEGASYRLLSALLMIVSHIRLACLTTSTNISDSGVHWPGPRYNTSASDSAMCLIAVRFEHRSRASPSVYSHRYTTTICPAGSTRTPTQCKWPKPAPSPRCATATRTSRTPTLETAGGTGLNRAPY